MPDIDSIIEQLGSAPAGYATPQQIEHWRATANALAQPTKPAVYTWASGLNDFTRSISSALHNRWANSAEQRNQASLAANVPGTGLDPAGGSPAPASSTATAPTPGSTERASWDGDPGNAVDFIKSQESYKATPYPDGAQTSIGYGTKAQPGETYLSKDDAHTRMVNEVTPIQQMIDQNVKVPLSPGQRTALTSFGYNAGPGALQKVLPQVNAGDFKGAADHMGQYIHFEGKPNDGLIKRRSTEIGLLMQPRPPQAAGAPPPAPPGAPGADPRFPPGQITTLPPGAPPSAGVPPPPNASAAPPPAQSPIQPAAFHPPSPTGGLPDNPTTMQAQTFAPGGQQTGGPGMPAPAAQPAAAGQGGAPQSLPLPPGVPTDDQIHHLLRIPQYAPLALQMQQAKAELLRDDVVPQPDGTVWMGNKYRNNWKQLPYMSKPDIIKSPLKIGGNEYEQNLVPTRGPGGQPAMREMNPVLNGQGMQGGGGAQPASAPGMPPQGGGIQPASNVQPAAMPQQDAGPAPSQNIPGSVPFPQNPDINSLNQFGMQNSIAKSVEQKTQESLSASRAKPVTAAIEAGTLVEQQLQQLGVIREAMKVPGISGGTWGDELQHMKSTFRQLTGYGADQVAAGERIAKINTKLAFTDTAEATKRPAYMEIVMNAKANPGLLNSVATSKYLVSIGEQRARQTKQLADLATSVRDPSQWPQIRDAFYESHPLLSPITGKPIVDKADSVRDLYALSMQSKASPKELEHLGKSLDLDPKDRARAEQMAQSDIAAKQQAEGGGQPAAPAAASPAQASGGGLPTPSSVQEAYKLGSGTKFIIPDGSGRIGVVP